MAKLYDVAILGATPAGLAAAIALAKAKRSVAVVAPTTPGAECPLIDWAPAELFTLAPFLKPIARAAAGQAFRAVRFHSTDAAKSVEHRDRKTLGYFVKPDKLNTAMRAAARKVKVQFVTSDGPVRPELAEHHVMLPGKREIRARTALIARDTPSQIITDLGLPVRNVPTSRIAAVGLDVQWTEVKVRKHFGRELHVVPGMGRDELILLFGLGPSVHARLLLPRDSGESTAEALSGLITRLRNLALIPPEMPTGRIRTGQWFPPAGVALELESHVAKRTLLIGTAGGFVDQVTAQTITPSTRSALLAAGVVNKALDSDDPQEVLNQFKNHWRADLANYLRPPNTAIHLLMPLMFVNQQIATRFARAMLYGESI